MNSFICSKIKNKKMKLNFIAKKDNLIQPATSGLVRNGVVSFASLECWIPLALKLQSQVTVES